MPHRGIRFSHVALFGFLLLSAFAMQGCLGILWLGVVGVDVARTSDVTFQSFENSWVGTPSQGTPVGFVKSITVTPFVGDRMMAKRWTMALQDMTDHRIESQGLRPRSAFSDIDCTLTGNVVDQEPQSSLMGLKKTSSHILYLRLTTISGALLWKTELPYTIVKGAKDLDENQVTNALLAHVAAHATKIGLAGLGATPMQVALQE